MHSTELNYDRVAAFYERAAHLYSFGAVRASKLAQIAYAQSGQRVLFLGAGGGEDAARMAKLGMDVTCVDLSAAMIARTAQRLEKRNAKAELIVGNALAHDRFGYYDAVCANYFFNIFSYPDMTRFFEHAVRLLKPGGLLMIADLAPADGSMIARSINRAAAYSARSLFRLAGLVLASRTYDYSELFEPMGLAEVACHDFRLCGYGPIMFRTQITRKVTS